ncbi:MAG: hypothetical protein AAGG51_05910 [Cyanobacteria bacterium P01_G01_bin.54]
MRTFTDEEKIRRYHLAALGLSSYTIRQLVKLVEFSVVDGAHEYRVVDIKRAIVERLQNQRLVARSRQGLEQALGLLEGKSNVVRVDFLKNVPLPEKLKIRNERIDELSVQEQVLQRETEAVLHQAVGQ